MREYVGEKVETRGKMSFNMYPDDLIEKIKKTFGKMKNVQEYGISVRSVNHIDC